MVFWFSFFFSSPILAQTLTTVMHLFFSLTSKCSHITIAWKKNIGSNLVMNLFPFLGYEKWLSIGVRRPGAPSHLSQGLMGTILVKREALWKAILLGASASIALCAGPRAGGLFSQLIPRHYLLFT